MSPLGKGISVPDCILVLVSVAVSKTCVFPSKLPLLLYLDISGSLRDRQIVILLYGYSRNQTAIALAFKALEEQGNRAVFINC